jgi:hypothetical protein
MQEEEEEEEEEEVCSAWVRIDEGRYDNNALV